MTVEEFVERLRANGIELTPTQLEQFETYYQLLVEWNEKINLTAITDKKEVYLKHFYDCLMPLWLMPLDHYEIQLCDVGAGAGFPSIPLKIVRPELKVTIVDSLNKRITFLTHLVETLGLQEVTCVHGRAEEVGQDKQYRGQFDLVTARAVAALNVLCEFCLPLVKKGGNFMALKAQKSEKELQDARNAIAILGAKLDKQATGILPIEESERNIILIKKTKETPNKYPRRAGKPAKQPII
ncbi:MAG: 16S rRNA (guanine(527)-N(7))-methyltransferase RsmG [Aerococcaceae bacterium]|nr:16S rRNA (guanine(527)-N(7))-methyltransferase RsmG [Aerococcaceae bacterium]